MTPLWQVLKRLADALLRVTEEPQRPPREMEEAIARDGLTPEELAEYHRRGGGMAGPDAPHIDDGGI